MRSSLIAFTFALIFSSCGSNSRTDKDMIGAESSVPTGYNSLSDSAHAQPLKPGNERVVVIETRNANGSSTTTTTTDINHNKSSVPKTSTVATPKTVSAAPVAGPVVTETKTEKKTGWSNRAKGAAIGGLGGAAAGAIISKKKVEGAVIGGVAGAAGGYIIGNEVDRNKAKQ